MAIAPLIVRVTAVGTAALTRTSAGLRAAAAAVASAGRSAVAASPALTRLAAALRAVRASPAMLRVVVALRAVGNAAQSAARAVVGRAVPAFSRLAAVLRTVASAALRAAVVIGGPLRRALNSAARAARDLAGTLLRNIARWTGIIGALLPFIFALGNVLANLLPLVAFLAPAAFAAGVALGVLKLGFEGVGDALSAGLSGDTEEYNKALAKLAPTAQEVVRKLVKLAPLWRSLQREVQKRLFVGVAKDIQLLSDRYFPILTRWLTRAADKFNNFFHDVAKGLNAPATLQQMDIIFAGVDSFIAGALRAVKALGRAFLDIAEAASPAFAELGADVGNWAEKFAGWVHKLKEDGTIAKWIEDAKKTFGQLMDIVKEVGRVIAAIFKGTDEGGFLENLKNSIKELADWLESDNGQAVIEFFSDMAKGAANAIVAIKWVADAVSDAIDWIRRVIPGGVDAFSGLFSVIAGGISAFGWIGDAIGKIGSLVGAVRGAVGAINAALGSIRTLVNIDIVTRYSTQGYLKPISSGGGGGGGSTFKARAAGGPVTRGVPYIVGEKRPEIFVPNQSGRILPRVPSGTGGSSSWSGSMSGLDALFFTWLQKAQRTGQLKLA